MDRAGYLLILLALPLGAQFTIRNPIDTAGRTAHKVQLHAHSSQTKVSGGQCEAGDTGGSDGDSCPSAVAAAYEGAGYSAWAMSDHDVRSTVDMTGRTITWIPGEELDTNHDTLSHLVLLGISSVVPMWSSAAQAAAAVHPSGVISLAHPTSRWWPMDWFDAAAPYVDLIEVWNNNEMVDRFDRALRINPALCAAGADDMHVLANFNRVWNVVYAASGSAADILAGLRACNGWVAVRDTALDVGMGLANVAVDQGTHTISLRLVGVSKWRVYPQWFQSDGTAINTAGCPSYDVEGNGMATLGDYATGNGYVDVSCTLTGSEGYARLQVSKQGNSAGGWLYGNPFRIEPAGPHVPHTRGRTVLQGTGRLK